MPHFPPPPGIPVKVGLFRRVPPLIFPAVLGLLGLGIAWRRGASAFFLPLGPVELFLGMVTLLFLFCLVAYGTKVFHRPGVIAEDAATLPGRTGLAALSMCLMVEAAVLAPYLPTLARLLLIVGFAGLVVLAAPVLARRLAGTDTSGPLSPAMHLVFVGVIVAPEAAVRLDLVAGAMVWVVRYSLLASLLITVLTGSAVLTGSGTPPLRPLQAFHLMPASLVATGALLTGQVALAQAALIWASILALALVLRARWMTAGAFSGFWSAFTFPLSAYAAALLMAGGTAGNPTFRISGGLVLVAATLVTLPVAYRVFKLWATGVLGAKTNAATA